MTDRQIKPLDELIIKPGQSKEVSVKFCKRNLEEERHQQFTYLDDDRDAFLLRIA